MFILKSLCSEDEDFSVLLKALEGTRSLKPLRCCCCLVPVWTQTCLFSTAYEGLVRGGASLPSLVCVITGEALNTPELGGAERADALPFRAGFQVRVLRRNTTGGRLLLWICSMSTSAPPGWRPKTIPSCWVRILNLKTVYYKPGLKKRSWCCSCLGLKAE